MNRKEAIEVLKDIVSKPMLYSNHIIGACRVALASLETDEAYQLEYERTTKNGNSVLEDIKAEIEGLKHIKVQGTWRSACDEAIGIVDEHINESVTPQEPRWIPVSERLPEESYNSILGWDAYRERCVLVQYVDGCFQIAGKTESFDIRAWMPLPLPWKGE